MNIDDRDKLKAHLLRELHHMYAPHAAGRPDPAPSTEADPDVLADYILALLDNAVLPLDEAMLAGKLEDFIAPRTLPAAPPHPPHAAQTRAAL